MATTYAQTPTDAETTFEDTVTLFYNVTPDDWPSNTTGSGRDIAALKLANQCVLGITLGFTMVAMGAAIEPRDFKIVLRRPVGVGIGLVCQVVLMPLLGFLLALGLRLSAPHALGVLITAASPGGTTSNLFTYWTDGDVCLSIVMTTISTVITLGSMPLNLFIYGRRWTDRGAVIPYKDIVIALVTFIGPVMLGMLLRWRTKKWALRIGTPFGILGMLGIMTSIIITVLINPSVWVTSWKLYVVTLTHIWLGWGFGYGLARLLRQPHRQSRTIGFETGLQQVGMALTLISFSYADDTALFIGVIVYPTFYGPFSILSFSSWTLGYKLYRHYRPEASCEEDEERREGSRGEDQQESRDMKYVPAEEEEKLQT